MKRNWSDSFRAAAWAVPPALGGLGVALVVFGRDLWTHPALPVAGLAAGAVAAVVGALTLGPAQARTRAWRVRLAEASHRLAELESDRRAAIGLDPISAVDALRLPEAQADVGFEEALSELDAALRDEERMRDRRREAEDAVREALRTGRALTEGTTESFPGIDRLPEILGRLGRAGDVLRDTFPMVQQSAIAGEEIAGLLGKHSRAGRDSSGRATQGVSELEGQVAIIEKLVRRLGARSREIGQILVVLDDITEQTNLLALNAGIIAAQAGSHGKGFAVVADEMRNLSERASSSTKETELLAQTLQDDVGQAVRAMQEAGENVRRLRATIGDSGEAANLVCDLVERTSDSAAGTVKAIETHTEGLRELSTALTRALEERESVLELEGTVLRPTRRLLRETIELLDAQWQAGALRESLRGRLEAAAAAMRERRGRERVDRRRLEDGLNDLRESGRRWADDLADRRRRDGLVSEISRDIHELAAAARDR